MRGKDSAQHKVPKLVLGAAGMIFGHSIAIGPILPIDIPSLFRWADDADAARLNDTYRPPNWHREEAFWLNADNDASRMLFAIRTKPGLETIGYVQIMAIQPIHRSAEIGIRIGEPSHRRNGYGGEALALAIDYCWKQLNLSRLSLKVFDHNADAVALYRRLGFEREGLLRQALFIDGGWTDLVLMALLRDDRQADRGIRRQAPFDNAVSVVGSGQPHSA